MSSNILRKYNRVAPSIMSYMQKKNFPRNLFRKVYRYYHHYYERKTAFDEAQILGELSEKLRGEVSSFMAFTTFSSAELFHKYDVKYLTLILLITKPVRVQHGETIIEAGQLGVEMFLITSGSLCASYKLFRSKERNLVQGDMFGELCALGLAERRQETVTAQEISELLSISKFDLFNTLGESAPHVLSDMRKSVVGKYNLMYRNKKRRVSFLPSVRGVQSYYFLFVIHLANIRRSNHKNITFTKA